MANLTLAIPNAPQGEDGSISGNQLVRGCAPGDRGEDTSLGTDATIAFEERSRRVGDRGAWPTNQAPSVAEASTLLNHAWSLTPFFGPSL